MQLPLQGVGSRAFPFHVLFKYDLSAKLLKASCFAANANISLLMPQIDQFTDVAVSKLVWKKRGHVWRKASIPLRKARDNNTQSSL